MPTIKHTILLVEDELHLHEALKLNLTLEGYEVSSAFDGPKALQQIQGASFDLIIVRDKAETLMYLVSSTKESQLSRFRTMRIS
jgi:DNA-binding response OmpR family regulator